jgi:phospholipid transport system substrate-binding protein
MKTLRTALALGCATLLLSATVPAPALAAVDSSTPDRFVQTLMSEGLAAIKSGDKSAAKARFRTLLAQHVAVDQIGDRLVRRWLPTITPAQRTAYKSALPGYIVGTYADRLFDYADANVKVIRAQPTAGGGVDVITQVLRPGQQPLPAVWSVVNIGGGWKVLNLRVVGINVAMAQAADFDSVIQRQGFDALIKLMRSRN